MGGTRFVGKSLVKKLLENNHQIDLFNRGNKPYPKEVNLIKGDRNVCDDIAKLNHNKYDLIYDVSGRELEQTKLLLKNIKEPFKRYLYVSSSGVYQNIDQIPLLETDPIDINSRHKGKYETENWLLEKKIPFTSFRPTYIYGPQNYNKIENWFFERIIKLKEVPLPGDGSLITQLGHVSDLTDAMIKSSTIQKCENNIYNCSSERGITIKGLILKCIEVCDLDINTIKLKSFDYKKLDPKSRKAFPIRLTHYQTSISKLKNDIDWKPKFDILNGLKDSYDKDFKYKLNEVFDKTSDNILF